MANLFEEDFKKIMDAGPSAMNVVNGLLPPDIKVQMTADQLALVDQANNATSGKELLKLSKQFENIAQNMAKNKR